MCLNRVEAKKNKFILRYLSDTCCTNSLQVSDTDPRSAGVKKKMIYLGHLSEFSDTCRRSVIGVSDTTTRIIIEVSVFHRSERHLILRITGFE
jgi:hypothetical protein